MWLSNQLSNAATGLHLGTAADRRGKRRSAKHQGRARLTHVHRIAIRARASWSNAYLALGIRADGRKEVLSLWIEQTEGAKFWMKVFNELKNRGLHDILIAVADSLRGFPEAIEAAIRPPKSRPASRI